jgi:mono/diheme cytochrome c family protein
MEIRFTRLLAMIFFLALGFSNAAFAQQKSLEESKQRGASLYQDFCINCHMAEGTGVPEVYPPLAGSDYLLNNRAASIRGVKYGQRGPMVVNGKNYDNTMMPLGLSDEEIADVMNYILNSWGNEGLEMVTPEEVNTTGPR